MKLFSKKTIFLLLLPRLLFLWSYYQTPYFDCFPEGLDSTRLDQFAQQIATGDILFTEGPYPQSPLYSYFLALIYFCFGLESRFWSVRVVQMLIGIGTGYLLWASTTRLWNANVGRWALLGYTLCPIFPYYEVQFLRVSLSLFLTMLCFNSWMCWKENPQKNMGILLGVSTGLLFLQEPHHLLIVPFLFCQKNLPWKKLLLFPLLAFLLILTPLILRNYWKEAPPLSISAQGPDVFISGHAPDALGVGWFVPPSSEMLKQSGGLASVIWETLKANHGNWRNYLQIQFRKATALCADFEVPNNFHFSFDRRAYRSWISLPLPTFGFFFGFGIAGILFMIFQEKRFQPVGGFLLGTASAVMAFYILSRFRIVCYLPLLMGSAYLWNSFRVSRKARYFGILGVILACFSYSYTSPDPRNSYGASNLANAYLLQAERVSEEASISSLTQALFWLEIAMDFVKKEYHSAPEWYRKQISMPPIRPAYWRKTLEVCLALQQWEKAQNILKELDVFYGEQKERNRTAWSLYHWKKGEQALQRRHWLEAKRFLEMAFQQAPTSEIAYDLIEANQKLFQQESHFSYLINQAMLLHYLQNPSEAKKLLLRSLDLQPPENLQKFIRSKLEEWK